MPRDREVNIVALRNVELEATTGFCDRLVLGVRCGLGEVRRAIRSECQAVSSSKPNHALT
jgi:hypothetical protein